MAKALTTSIKFTSRASVKIGESYYTVECCEERMIPVIEGIEAVDVDEARRNLWNTVNGECDKQIEDILNTFKK